MNASDITHFLKIIGGGSMARGIFAIIIIGGVSENIRNKLMNTSGKSKETPRSQWVMLTLSGFGVLIWAVWTITLQ